ncbi:MAG: metallopeptidase family protein [Anaerolineae bacterium]|nr:metallopeptidase family protein [Anaerolineae bacterium]
MEESRFAELVAEAWNALPEFFREKLENVELVVEDWPDPETMRRAGVRHRSQLLGFYHGVPLPERTHNYVLVLPDRISIYRRPILMRCRNWREVSEMVYRVLRHEVGHYFGLSDDRLRELGAY